MAGLGGDDELNARLDYLSQRQSFLNVSLLFKTSLGAHERFEVSRQTCMCPVTVVVYISLLISIGG